jgi:hypothetical protein
MTPRARSFSRRAAPRRPPPAAGQAEQPLVVEVAGTRCCSTPCPRRPPVPPPLPAPGRSPAAAGVGVWVGWTRDAETRWYMGVSCMIRRNGYPPHLSTDVSTHRLRHEMMSALTISAAGAVQLSTLDGEQHAGRGPRTPGCVPGSDFRFGPGMIVTRFSTKRSLAPVISRIYFYADL